MECKNLGRERVSFTSYIYQGACLSCAEFVIVSEHFARVFVFVCCVCSLWCVCGSVCSFSVCLLSISCVPDIHTGESAVTKADSLAFEELII